MNYTRPRALHELNQMYMQGYIGLVEYSAQYFVLMAPEFNGANRGK